MPAPVRAFPFRIVKPHNKESLPSPFAKVTILESSLPSIIVSATILGLLMIRKFYQLNDSGILRFDEKIIKSPSFDQSG